MEEGEDHRRWLVNHQRNEIVFWNAKAEELEHQLRRRTAVLVTLLTCAVLSAVAAAGTLFVQLAASRAPDQAGVAASPPQSQVGLPLSAEPPRAPPLSDEAAQEATARPSEPDRVPDTSSAAARLGDQQVARLEHDLIEAQRVADEARREADQLALQVQELTGARGNLEQQVGQSSQAAAQAAQELKARAERIAVLERDAGTAEQRLVERAAEITRLASELRDVTKAREELQAEVAERTRLLEQAGRDLQARADRIGALEGKLGSTEQQVRATEQQLAGMTQLRDQATRVLEARDQRIAALEGELARAREAAERSRAEIRPPADAVRDAAELRPTTSPQELRVAALEPAPNGAADGPRKTVLASDIFIVPGSSQLAARASVPLDQAAQFLRQSSGLVRIIGHMDATGNPDSNRQLSLRRAQAVRDYLVSTYRFDPARFTVEGRGSDEPVASNNTAAGRHANRRVELFLAE